MNALRAFAVIGVLAGAWAVQAASAASLEQRRLSPTCATSKIVSEDKSLSSRSDSESTSDALDASIVVASQGDGSVSKIDPASGRVVLRVAVDRGPASVAASPSGREVFVTHPDGTTIEVIDATSGRVARRLPYKGEAFGVAAGVGTVYVSDWAHDVVTRLDAVTGEPQGTVAVGESPAGLVIDLAHHRLYVADRESDDITVIDTDGMSTLATIGTAAAPFALALSPDGGRLYVANVRSNDVTVIDTVHLQGIATVAAGTMPYGVAVTSDGRSILVTNQHGDSLTIVDAKTLAIAATVGVGRYPEGVIAANNRAYVANWFSGDVSVIDLGLRQEVTRIKVGDGPRNFARVVRQDPMR